MHVHPSEIESYLEQEAGLGKSFDVGVRKLTIAGEPLHLYFITGLVDTRFIIELIESLLTVEKKRKEPAIDILKNHFVHQSVEEINDQSKLTVALLSGLIVIAVPDGVFTIDVRSYPGRQPEEPDTEKVVRGSRDGYVENIVINTALTRRRIRDGRLRFEMMKAGSVSKLDIAVGYMEGIADPIIVEKVKKEIESIDIAGVPMADKTVEEFIVKQRYNPFPLVRYTERADIGAAHLLEGHVLLFTDTSPAVMIMPATYLQHLQHAEEYRQLPAAGTFIRMIRYIGLWMSLFLLPLWFLFAQHPEMLPEALSFIGPNEKTKIPLAVQILIADVGIEWLRIAAIHTPMPLSTAMGLVAAVMIGQIAIDTGLFVPEVILYTALAAIGTFSTPSYELGLANKMIRLFFILSIAFFGAAGFVIAFTLFFLFLVRLKPFGAPYLWPLVPFDAKSLLTILIRRQAPEQSGIPQINRVSSD
ncbi:spore germination protein [Domibacillus epiphyticus]|uniref:Spore germination protein n=2 Tax=Domibacillus epiphyticus TaxID=1714355 RepID=A0A1V2A4G9_9BACI|nr:spore germination protein [Domibacillus epiphyticus]OMP65901.1 spore germination protein [Domibacillus epiphyticus]